MLRESAFALLVLVASASAQEAPFATPLFHAGQFPLYVATGDLDGDGLEDVVFSNESDLTVLLQGPLGALGAELATPTTAFAQHLVLADFDGDGDLDVAASVDSINDSVEAMSVQLGEGDGTFGEAEVHLAGLDPTDIAAGDLDEDGVLDVVTAGSSTLRVSVFFGLGAGDFDPKVDIGAGGNPHGLAIGLIDGDDHLDLAVACHSGVLGTLLGDGAGGFAAPATVAIGSNGRHVALGDVDVDGALDALVAYAVPQIRLLHGHGDGTWTADPPIPTQSSSLRAVLADVDEDGDDDGLCLLAQAALSPVSEGFGVLLSEGDGTLAPLQRYGSPLEPSDFAVADLNHDGELDILGALPKSLVPANVIVLAGRGDGTFGPVLKTGDAPEELAAADLDGDGHDELLVACGSSDAVALHRGLGHGEFDAASVLVPMGDFPVGLAVADIVEDGLLDLLVANRHSPGQVTVRAGDGALGFGAPIVSLPGDVPFGMASGDANLDGHLDLVLPGNGSKALIALGDGAGHFAVSDTVSVPSVTPDAAAFGDLDLDGQPDLVVANSSAAVVSTALSQGGGQFGPTTSVAAPTTHQHDVALADLTGDGFPEVVVPGGFWNNVCIYANDGAGHLVLQTTLSANAPMAVALADVDGDELVDIVASANVASASAAFGALTTWLQAAGGFGLAQQALTGGSPNLAAQELLLHDLDGDGALDAAMLVLETDDLWLLFNRTGPWDDLGLPLAGTLGLPRQFASGSLQPGAPFEIELVDARPAGTTWLIVGLSAIFAPFKGGTYVPSPLLSLPLPLDPEGGTTLAGTWPAPAAPGAQLWFQFWTQDPAGIKGWSASNALRATLP
jgi:FG-GAP-like repeat